MCCYFVKVWQFLKKLKRELPTNSTTRLIPWGNQNWKSHMYSNVYCCSITIAGTWKQPRCSLTDEWIKTLWYIYTMEYSVQFSSVAKLRLTLWPQGLQHSRLPCPSLSPRVCSDSCPLSQWCYLTISSCHPLLLLSSVFPSIRVFSNESVLRASGGQSVGTAASVLPMNIHGWFPLGLTGWISFLSKGLSRVFSNTTVWKHQFFGPQPSLWSNSHICTWLLEKQ